MQSAAHTFSRMRIGLGTFVAIEAEAPSARAGELGIEAAFSAIGAVDRLMHPTRSGSDLDALATAPCGSSIEIHPWTWEVLDLSRRLFELSAGAFDPCLESAPGRLTDIDLSRHGHAATRVPVHLDLGGIAKGFAVDRALDALRASGCEGGLVNAGGDLAVFGRRTHRIVRVRGDGTHSVVMLEDGAVAASDAGRLDRPSGHRGYYNRSDGGRANRGRVVTGSATVIAPTAAVADALTKCVLVGEPGLMRNLLETFDARAWGDLPDTGP
jgi:thiamine biosynthesis lipoprotein